MSNCNELNLSFQISRNYLTLACADPKFYCWMQPSGSLASMVSLCFHLLATVAINPAPFFPPFAEFYLFYINLFNYLFINVSCQPAEKGNANFISQLLHLLPFRKRFKKKKRKGKEKARSWCFASNQKGTAAFTTKSRFTRFLFFFWASCHTYFHGWYDAAGLIEERKPGGKKNCSHFI